MQIDSILEKLTEQELLIEKAIDLGEVPTRLKNQIDTSIHNREYDRAILR